MRPHSAPGGGEGQLRGMWELYLTYLQRCAKSVIKREKKNMSKGNPRGRADRRGIKPVK